MNGNLFSYSEKQKLLKPHSSLYLLMLTEYNKSYNQSNINTMLILIVKMLWSLIFIKYREKYQRRPGQNSCTEANLTHHLVCIVRIKLVENGKYSNKLMTQPLYLATFVDAGKNLLEEKTMKVFLSSGASYVNIHFQKKSKKQCLQSISVASTLAKLALEQMLSHCRYIQCLTLLRDLGIHRIID